MAGGRYSCRPTWRLEDYKSVRLEACLTVTDDILSAPGTSWKTFHSIVYRAKGGGGRIETAATMLWNMFQRDPPYRSPIPS